MITPTFATISTSPEFTTYRAIEFAPCVGQVWYADADGDSYGNPLVTLTNCTQPYGYVSNSLDCNDASANAYPGATEICNGGDDDCDTTIDEACINVAANNNRSNAIVSSVPNYPQCLNIYGNLAAATCCYFLYILLQLLQFQIRKTLTKILPSTQLKVIFNIK